MCGRFVIYSEAEEREIQSIIEEVNQKSNGTAIFKNGEIYPTDNVPIVTLNEDIKDASICKWGFPNFKGSGVIINARAETLDEKSMFRKSFHSKRCLIPAHAFFEWKSNSDGKKQKHIIKASEKSFFYMAGIYNTYIDKSGQPYTGFVIITTEASPQMSKVHNRMPVMFTDEELVDSWLKPNNLGTLKDLLVGKNEITIDVV